MGFMNNIFLRKKDLKSIKVDEKNSVENKSSSKVDVNEPVKNPKLKELLSQFFKNSSSDSMNNVCEEIALNAHFLSVITVSSEPESNGDGTSTFKENSIIQFPLLTSQDGQSCYPAFTDWAELLKWEGLISPKTLILSFDDYAAMVKQNENVVGVVINPFSDVFVLNQQMIEQMNSTKELAKNGVHKIETTKETTVLIGEPNNYPTEMTNAISNYFNTTKTVKRAWLRLMRKGQEQSFLLVVDVSGDYEKLFVKIAAVARPYLNNMYLDMVPYQDGFGKAAVDKAVPFYQR